MSEEHFKREQQERKAIGKFYQKHPGWHLSEVFKCPTRGCGKFLYCEGHRYAYRKWWINLSIGLKQ